MTGTEPPRPPGLLRALRLPLVLLLLLGAADVAQRRLLPTERAGVTLDRLWLALLVGAGVLLVQRLLLATLDWAAADGARSRGFAGMVPLVRRATNVGVAVLGVLLVLDQLGISISPLLAGLGITGIAVALALQPLLTNLFAGSYVLSDASIREGDVIALPGGPEGRVESIGWRATRLRGPEPGSLVIVPNATLAAATVTNYGANGPTEATAVFPLARSADLAQAERAALEVLQALIATHAGIASDAEPVVRFVRVTEKRVELLLRVRANSSEHVPALTHELIRRVGDRFRVDGVAQD
jgi:small-conductance mechanosensitive channel